MSVLCALICLQALIWPDILVHDDSIGAEFQKTASSAGLVPIRRFRHIPWTVYRGSQKNESGILVKAFDQGWTVEKNLVWKLAALPDDPDINQQWPVMTTYPDADIRLQQAWNIRASAPDVVLAVIDTGVRIDHEDLAGNIWNNEQELGGTPGVDDDGNGYVDDINGWNTNQDSSDVVDTNGHGTRVAGIAAAVGDNTTGIAGVCWNVQVMTIRAFTTSTTTTDALLGGIDYILANPGVDVVNASWGELDVFSTAMEDAIRRLKDEGVLVVAAAGNDGADLDTTPFYPACYNLDNIVSVAAIDETGVAASFGAGFSTNFGTKVSLAAPGRNIYTTDIYGGYSHGQGTSMSAPYISAAACLARSFVPGISPIQIRDKFIDTAVQTTALQPTPVNGGLVNIDAFLESMSVTSSGYWHLFN